MPHSSDLDIFPTWVMPLSISLMILLIPISYILWKYHSYERATAQHTSAVQTAKMYNDDINVILDIIDKNPHVVKAERRASFVTSLAVFATLFSSLYAIDALLHYF